MSVASIIEAVYDGKIPCLSTASLLAIATNPHFSKFIE